jgi:hypothetical protein
MLTSILVSCSSLPLFLSVSLLSALARKFHMQLSVATSGGARTPIKLVPNTLRILYNLHERVSVKNNHKYRIQTDWQRGIQSGSYHEDPLSNPHTQLLSSNHGLPTFL